MSMRRRASPCPVHAHYSCRADVLARAHHGRRSRPPTGHNTSHCAMPCRTNPTATGGPSDTDTRVSPPSAAGFREPAGLATADLYWVSAPMTSLARHAADRLPTRTLHAHDLPSRSGFMVFEAPLATYVNDEGREVQIVAVSWGPWDGPGGRWDQGGIWLSF